MNEFELLVSSLGTSKLPLFVFLPSGIRFFQDLFEYDKSIMVIQTDIK